MSQPANTITALKRISWIDICRGLGMILVLYGHVFTDDSQRYLIYSFHMPLFFFLSGLVFKPVLNKPLKTIIIKHFKQLLLPYFAFAIFTYLFALLTNPLRDLTPGGIAWQLFGILYGSGNNGMLGFNVVLWFLPCLFITKLTFALITRKVLSNKTIGLILAASGFAGYLFSQFLPWIKLPFGFEIALSAMVFFGLGYLWKVRKYALHALKPYRLPIMVVAMIITVGAAYTNYHLNGTQIDMRVNRLNNVFLFYIGAISGIATWVMLSQLIRKSALLEYIGQNSMVIFAWHYLIFVNLQAIMSVIASDEFINSLKMILPTFYVLMATTIILISRKMMLMLKNAYRFLPLN